MLSSRLIPVSVASLDEWKKIEENSICFIGSTQQIDFTRLFDSAGLRSYMVFSVYDDETLIGGIIFQVVPNVLKKRLVSMGGPTAAEQNLDKIMYQLNLFIKKNKGKFSFSISFIPQPCLNIPEDLLKYRSKYSSETSIIVLKDRTLDSLWKGIKKGRKGDIKKAEKIMKINKVSDLISLPDVYNIIKDHSKMNKYGADLNLEILESLFVIKEKFRIYAAFNNDGKMIAVAGFHYFHPDSMHLLFLARRYDTTESQYSESALIWHSIKTFFHEGYHYLDLSGLPAKSSSKQGIRYFKLSFGGEIMPYVNIETNLLRRMLLNINNKGKLSGIILDKIRKK